MTKRLILFVVLLSVLCISAINCLADNTVLSITGAVKYPVSLDNEDFKKFQTVTVRINDVDSSGKCRGAFNVQAVPLRYLLEVTKLKKEDSGFMKPIDLAIAVRDVSGKQVVLSWGEVFYKNPSNVSIAFSAVPVIPHFAASGAYTEQLNRKISFPKLVVANDYYSDRSLEGIVNIEVIDLTTRMPSKRLEKLFSPDFSITGDVKNRLTINDLSSYPRTEVSAIIIGEGRGFVGTRKYHGVPLKDLLEKAGIQPDMNTVFLAGAPDGYRTLISSGELFLSLRGKDIVVADMDSGKPLKNGKFILAIPDDLFADRDIQALSKIEVITLKKKSKIYIIGVGPGDTNLITPEALSYIGKSDALICPEDISRRFEVYLAGKEILFSPMKIMKLYSKVRRGSSSDAEKKELEIMRLEAVNKVREKLSAGKNVALIDWGDPLVYGSSKWIQEYFTEEQLEVVPSISAFNASNAIINRDMTCKGSLVITDPIGLKNNEALLKAAAEHGDTLAIFMGLRELKRLMPLLGKYYKDSTYITIVYNAGISRSEQVIRSTLRKVMDDTESNQEKHLGMIYIGPCLAPAIKTVTE